MPGERLILNPVSESTSNAPLELVGPNGTTSWGTLLLDHAYPAPARSPVVASSSDTEGDFLAHTSYQNREISMTLRVAEPTEGAGTNLATNPRAAVDTTGWTNSGLAGMTRVVLDQTGTPTGLQGAETALRAQGNSDADVGYLSAAVTSGLTYRFSAYVYLDTNTATGVKLTARNASGTLKASSSTLSTLDTWTRLDVSVAADSTATWRFGIEQIGAGAADAYATMVLIEQSSSLGEYFDGDTPGCSWSSTRHQSSSTRPATGGARFYSILDDLQSTVDRIVREGGTLKRVAPGAKPIVFDLIDASVEIPQGNAFLHGKRTTATLTFTAKPFYRRGEWLQLSDHPETSAAHLTWTETGIDGEVPALAKLVVDEDQGVDQRWLAWGIESRNYSSASTASTFYEAEALTLKTSAAIATRTSASGGASNNVVRHSDLVDDWQQVLSTQATGGGSHLSHVGTFRVFARVFDATTNGGTISLRLEWGQGDFRKTTQNASASPVSRGDFSLVDLGVVKLDATTQGTQRWEGRILAKSTTIGDDIDVDYLWIVPVEDGGGEIIATPEASSSIATLNAYDTFTQAAGALAGKTPAIPSSGGNWAGAGDADDFQVSGASAYNVTRTAVSDAANTGRWAVAGTAVTSSGAAIDLKFSATPTGSFNDRLGVILRYTDTNNWCGAFLESYFGTYMLLRVYKRVAGTITRLNAAYDLVLTSTNTVYNLSLTADASGNYVASVKLGSATLKTASGTDSVLATAGTLASGKGGIYDEWQEATACTRTYDNFSVESYGTSDAKQDAAMFASQSCELRSDAVVREDSTGTVWNDVSRYEGDYLKLPASGRDNRTIRFTLKASRYSPDSGADSGIDDISARLSYQPRGITVSDASA
jgi:hypothetical protein